MREKISPKKIISLKKLYGKGFAIENLDSISYISNIIEQIVPKNQHNRKQSIVTTVR